MADNNIRKSIKTKTTDGSHSAATEDTRDIFDKALEDSYPQVGAIGGLVGGMLVGGLAGKAYGKAKKFAGKKVSGDEGFLGHGYGGLAGMPAGYIAGSMTRDKKKSEKRK